MLLIYLYKQKPLSFTLASGPPAAKQPWSRLWIIHLRILQCVSGLFLERGAHRHKPCFQLSFQSHLVRSGSTISSRKSLFCVALPNHMFLWRKLTVHSEIWLSNLSQRNGQVGNSSASLSKVIGSIPDKFSTFDFYLFILFQLWKCPHGGGMIKKVDMLASVNIN